MTPVDEGLFPNSIGAMPSARATHASHRARLRGLGHAVGIAIAALSLSACDDHGQPTINRWDERDYFQQCLNGVGAFQSPSGDVIRECRSYAEDMVTKERKGLSK